MIRVRQAEVWPLGTDPPCLPEMLSKGIVAARRSNSSEQIVESLKLLLEPKVSRTLRFRAQNLSGFG
jgi:hypothetical protein